MKEPAIASESSGGSDVHSALQGSSSSLVAPPAAAKRGALSVVIASAIIMGLGMAPLFFGTFPLFLLPVSRAFGWSAAIFPQSIMIAGCVGALTGPVIGRCIDAVGVRKVMLPGLVVWATSLFCMSYIHGSIPLLYVVCVVLGVAAACCGPIALAKVISGWFDRRRGLVLNLVLSAAPAVSTATLLLLTRYLIETRGWQFSYRVLAVVVIVVTLPTCYLFIRETPAEPMVAPSGGMARAGGIRLSAALRSRAFWTVTGGSMLICAAANALFGHFVAWSAERGIDTATASIALTLFSLAGPIGSVLAGALADRASNPRALAFIFMLPLAGEALFFFGGHRLAMPALALVGGGFSAVSGLIPFFTARYFGLAYASTIFGVALGLLTFSLGVGPVLLGVARDSLGAYGPAAPALMGCLIVGTLMIASLPSYPSRVTPRT